MKAVLFVVSRLMEISSKVHKKGINWALRKAADKEKEMFKSIYRGILTFLRDIRYRGISNAIMNRYIEVKLLYLNQKSYNFSSPRRKAPFPLHCHIEVTSNCNLSCTMCPRDEISKRESGNMKFDVFKRIIDELSTRNTPNTLFLHFSGEPLLNSDLPEMISYAKKKGVPWIKFNTNMVLLDEKRSLKILESGLDCIVCAIEMSEEDQNKLRPGAEYNKVTNNLIKFMELKKEGNYQKPLVKLQMLVTKGNYMLQKSSYNQWKNIVDRVDFHPLHTVGGLVNDLGATKVKRLHCEQLWVSLIFLWNGDAVPCCFNHDGSLKAGNILTQSLEEIWNSEFLENLRRDDKEGIYRNPVCQRCMAQGIDY